MNLQRERARQPKGTPIGGQYAAERKAEASGVSLDYVNQGHDLERDPRIAEPADLTDVEAMEALRGEHDILGLGVGYQQVVDGVHVYYDNRLSRPIGVAPGSDGRVHVFDYDDIRPFGEPVIGYEDARGLDPGEANYRVAEHLGVNLDATRLMARATYATDEEKTLLKAVFEQVNAGDGNKVRDAVFDAIADARLNDRYLGRTSNMNDSQGSRATGLFKGYGADHQALTDAVYALQNRALVDDPRVPGWTQEAYDHLTAPVRQVFGQIHPDDEPMDRITPGFEEDVAASGMQSTNPSIRRYASDLSRSILEARLNDLRVTSYTVWADLDQMGVDHIEISGNPDPDENYALYGEAKEAIAERIGDFTSPQAIRAREGWRQGLHEEFVKEADRTFTVPKVDRTAVAARALQVRQMLAAQDHEAAA